MGQASVLRVFFFFKCRGKYWPIVHFDLLTMNAVGQSGIVYLFAIMRSCFVLNAFDVWRRFVWLNCRYIIILSVICAFVWDFNLFIGSRILKQSRFYINWNRIVRLIIFIEYRIFFNYIQPVLLWNKSGVVKCSILFICQGLSNKGSNGQSESLKCYLSHNDKVTLQYNTMNLNESHKFNYKQCHIYEYN